jgi:hypothetical protein
MEETENAEMILLRYEIILCVVHEVHVLTRAGICSVVERSLKIARA